MKKKWKKMPIIGILLSHMQALFLLFFFNAKIKMSLSFVIKEA